MLHGNRFSAARAGEIRVESGATPRRTGSFTMIGSVAVDCNEPCHGRCTTFSPGRKSLAAT